MWQQTTLLPVSHAHLSLPTSFTLVGFSSWTNASASAGKMTWSTGAGLDLQKTKLSIAKYTKCIHLLCHNTRQHTIQLVHCWARDSVTRDTHSATGASPPRAAGQGCRQIDRSNWRALELLITPPTGLLHYTVLERDDTRVCVRVYLFQCSPILWCIVLLVQAGIQHVWLPEGHLMWMQAEGFLLVFLSACVFHTSTIPVLATYITCTVHIIVHVSVRVKPWLCSYSLDECNTLWGEPSRAAISACYMYTNSIGVHM